MLRALSCSVLALSLIVFGVDAGGGKDGGKKDTPVKDAGKDKDKGKDKKNYEVPKDAIAGMFKSVNHREKTFTIMVDTKARKFLVDDKTEFWGPRGGDRGTGPEGLKDRCMEKGHELRVVASKDGKTAVDVHLPFHKSEKKDDKDKDKK